MDLLEGAPPLRMCLRPHNGVFVADYVFSRGNSYRVDRDRGSDHVEDLASPGYFTAELSGGQSVAFVAGTEAITRLGGASAGDRTMVDALLPAAAALRRDPADLVAAAKAARQGAEATSAMAPRRGRSSYIGARAVGHPDPGAVAVAMLLEAIAAGS